MVNKKTVKSATGITLKLLVICLVVATLTALVYAITEKPIASGERERKETAIRAIFADAASFAETEMTGEGINIVYRVFDASAQHLGWCVDYTGNSDYGGAVNMMIGVGLDGKVTGVQVISHAETFMDRYLDKNGRYTGADLSAGATLSYNAIRDAIRAIEAYFAPFATVTAAPKEVTLDAADVELLFAAATDFSERETVTCNTQTGMVNAVCVVKDGAGKVLGRCVHYTAVDGYRSDIDLLLAVSTEGKVTDVLLLDFVDDRLEQYLDGQNRYTGTELPRGSDAVGGSTRSYNAIRNAMETVEGLNLGGVA